MCFSLAPRPSPCGEPLPDLDLAPHGGRAEEAGSLEGWLAGKPLRGRSPASPQQRWPRGRRPILTTSLTAALLAVVAAAVVGNVGYWDTSARLDWAQRQWLAADEARRQAEATAAEAARRAENALHTCRSVENELVEARWQVRPAEQRLDADVQQPLRQPLETIHQQSRESQLATAMEMARESRELLGSDPKHSLLLAGAALRVMLEEGQPPDPATEQTLRNALALVGNTVLEGHRGAIPALAISGNGRWLVTGSDDRTARLWDLHGQHPPASSILLSGHEGRITTVVISPDDRWLVTAGDDATAIVWDLTAPDPTLAPRVLRGHQGPINAGAISPDSRWLVTAAGTGPAGDGNAARLWDLSADDPSAAAMVLRGHENQILAVTFSADGRWVATAGEDQTIRLYNLTARYPAAEQFVLCGHEGPVSALAASGRWLVSGSYDGTARLWDLQAADPAASAVVLRGHQGWVGAVAIAADDRWIATGSFDRTVRLWDLRAADPAASPHVLRGHEGRIQAVAFSPDCRWLATASFDHTARLWNLGGVAPAASSMVLRGHRGPIRAMAISADSRWLATAGGDHRDGSGSAVQIWDLQLDGLLETARRTVAQYLDPQQQHQLLSQAARRAAALR